MACTLQETAVDATYDYQDTLVYTYQADLEQMVEDPLTAIALAQTMGPKPLPQRRQQHPSGAFLFALSIKGQRTKEHRNVWMFEVTYGPPPKGEDKDQQVDNPLLRPAIYDIQYIEEEYTVTQARNVLALGDEFGGGGPFRAAGTLGQITNGAGTRPDEPIMRTTRRAEIVIYKNLPDLGVLVQLNEDFQETANSDSITLGNRVIAPRRLKFEMARSTGMQVENGVSFYPAVIEISIHRTTDLVFDNVGYQYYTSQGKLKRAVGVDGLETAEPINLTIKGRKQDPAVPPSQIIFRDLAEAAYSGFFS